MKEDVMTMQGFGRGVAYVVLLAWLALVMAWVLLVLDKSGLS
jgi:hypothetical protein